MVATVCACGCKSPEIVSEPKMADDYTSTTTATGSSTSTTTSTTTAPATASEIAAAEAAKPATLTETKWVLTHLYGAPFQHSLETPYIIFTGDRVTGSLGCNTFFGTFYANKKGKISIEYTGSTKKLCNEMEVEYQFISAMKSEKMTYLIKGGTLTIYGEKMDTSGVKKEMEIMRFKVDR